MQPIIPAAQLLEYIPQRPPMRLLDALWQASEQTAISSWLVPADSVFCWNGQLQAVALIENIAQTAAAHAGYWARQRQESPAVGFIGAVKDFQVHRLPRAGEELRTALQVGDNVLNFSLVKGIVFIGTERIAEAELKIFLQTDL